MRLQDSGAKPTSFTLHWPENFTTRQNEHLWDNYRLHNVAVLNWIILLKNYIIVIFMILQPPSVCHLHNAVIHPNSRQRKRARANHGGPPPPTLPPTPPSPSTLGHGVSKKKTLKKKWRRWHRGLNLATGDSRYWIDQ